jgi:hypothetical protein
MPIGAIIGGASSIIGNVIGASQASKAAAAQAAAAQQAQGLIQNNANQALGTQQKASQQEQGNLQPYVQAGQTSLANLGATQPFKAPTAEQAAATPGYQFQLQQGLKSLQNSAAARGGLLTGGTSKAINDYAQGAAASNYGNTYNQALQSYQTNFGNQMGIAQLGANAGTNLSGLEQGNANASGGILQNSAQEQAQQINNAGAARASGYAARGNMLGNAISGAGNAIGNGISLSQLNGYSQFPAGYNAGGGPGQLYGNDVTGVR